MRAITVYVCAYLYALHHVRVLLFPYCQHNFAHINGVFAVLVYRHGLTIKVVGIA